MNKKNKNICSHVFCTRNSVYDDSEIQLSYGSSAYILPACLKLGINIIYRLGIEKL